MTDSLACEDNADLHAFIHQQIEKKGGIPFSEYMEYCLYHPQFGYYMGSRQRIGTHGDFFTSSTVHRLFGGLLAKQLHQMWQLLADGPFTIVEQGAGDGFLALDILDTIKREYPDFYAKLCYQLIEISPDNRRRQQQNLAEHQTCLQWCRFEEVTPFDGCFLSNELVDAFTVSIVEKHDGVLQEVYVVNGDNGFGEELRTPVSEQIQYHFDKLGVAPVEGNRAEVCLYAAQWIRSVAEKLRRGFVLTIDYGYPAAELYAPFRRQGTLLCYYHHTANDNPYQNIGCQDLTSHVDFTLLQQWGEEQGLDCLYFGEQYRFLMGLGFIEELVKLQAAETDERKACALRMTLKNLILPDGGMGETFKVLVQGKGVATPVLLCQRSIQEISLESLALSS